MEDIVMTKRAGRSSLAICMLMIAMLITAAPAAPVALAGGLPGSQAASGDLGVADLGGDVNRWWGAYGAIACGLEARLIRTVPPIGMHPYMLAAGIGGCLLALMDICTTK